jgi:hypothetical protein
MFLKEKKEEWALYVKAVSDVLAMNRACTAFASSSRTAHEIMGV